VYRCVSCDPGDRAGWLTTVRHRGWVCSNASARENVCDLAFYTGKECHKYTMPPPRRRMALTPHGVAIGWPLLPQEERSSGRGDTLLFLNDDNDQNESTIDLQITLL
jgi:hypothetical protein